MYYADIMFYLALGILFTYIFICVTVVAISWLIDLGYYVITLFERSKQWIRMYVLISTDFNYLNGLLVSGLWKLVDLERWKRNSCMQYFTTQTPSK